MRFLLVFMEPRRIREDVVREMIVLINEEINLPPMPATYIAQIIQLFHSPILLVQLLLCVLGQQGGIRITK